ncbi:MAG TPA: type II toxin-antitoxin system Phd/YefM family antitoxin [Thermomicrobiales bacterium]|nr:type II toxin-antitoxin system Phd/YefM family antitoxin [Thermomicrobiales bacterium]
MITITYDDARAHLGELLDRVIEDRESVIIMRPGRESVALIAAEDLEGLFETVHLLRSRTNAVRLRPR